VFVSNSLGYVSAKNWQIRMTSDKNITKIKRVGFFSETQCKCLHSSLKFVFHFFCFFHFFLTMTCLFECLL